VFSFCSTKRKGKHKLEIAIDTPSGEVKLSHKFDAAGFKNGCSPKTKPMFEEIEAMKSDSATKQKELDAKAKAADEAEAQRAADAALKNAAPGKEVAKDGGKSGSKDNAKAGAKEAAKTSGAAPEKAKPAANQWNDLAKAAPPKGGAKAAPAPAPAPAAEEEEEAPPPPKKAAPSTVKQAVDKE
jgi:hypothetical protein